MSLGWKIFRFICILQMVLVASQALMCIARVFAAQNSWYNLLVTGIYFLMAVFIYQGLSILNYNYPDTPLTVKQKRSFNWLFLTNFLLIAFLFARVINHYSIVPFVLNMPWTSRGFLFLVPFLCAVFIFAFHLLLLTGFYMLRRNIHQRTIAGWYQQFETNKS